MCGWTETKGLRNFWETIDGRIHDDDEVPKLDMQNWLEICFSQEDFLNTPLDFIVRENIPRVTQASGSLL